MNGIGAPTSGRIEPSKYCLSVSGIDIEVGPDSIGSYGLYSTGISKLDETGGIHVDDCEQESPSSIFKQRALPGWSGLRVRARAARLCTDKSVWI